MKDDTVLHFLRGDIIGISWFAVFLITKDHSHKLPHKQISSYKYIVIINEYVIYSIYLFLKCHISPREQWEIKHMTIKTAANITNAS
jgi:hypothetical protein